METLRVNEARRLCFVLLPFTAPQPYIIYAFFSSSSPENLRCRRQVSLLVLRRQAQWVLLKKDLLQAWDLKA